MSKLAARIESRSYFSHRLRRLHHEFNAAGTWGFARASRLGLKSNGLRGSIKEDWRWLPRSLTRDAPSLRPN
jgi:hypothetical protein